MAIQFQELGKIAIALQRSSTQQEFQKNQTAYREALHITPLTPDEMQASKKSRLESLKHKNPSLSETELEKLDSDKAKRIESLMSKVKGGDVEAARQLQFAGAMGTLGNAYDAWLLANEPYSVFKKLHFKAPAAR